MKLIIPERLENNKDYIGKGDYLPYSFSNSLEDKAISEFSEEPEESTEELNALEIFSRCIEKDLVITTGRSLSRLFSSFDSR